MRNFPSNHHTVIRLISATLMFVFQFHCHKMSSVTRFLALFAILVIFLLPHPSNGFYHIGREIDTRRQDIGGQDSADRVQSLGFDDILRQRMAVLREARRMKQLNEKNDH